MLKIFMQILGAMLLACASLVSFSAASFAQESNIDELRERAESGDVEAQWDISVALVNNALNDTLSSDQIMSDERLVEGRAWAKKAADAGEAEAMNVYANYVMNGWGGEADTKQGFKLVESAAEKGSSGALLNLSAWYSEGTSFVKKNDKRAFEYMEKSANHKPQTKAGYAQWKLAMMYLDGVGTKKNSQKAYAWTSKAADNGEVNGMISRAVMLATGDGVAEDDAEAFKWYHKAAHSGKIGFEHGARGLAIMYWAGEGVAVDRAKGCMFINIANQYDDEFAKQIMGQIFDELLYSERDQCNADAEKWIVENIGTDRQAAK